MLTPDSPISQRFQAVAEATHDYVTPANAIDAVAFGLAINAAPQLDTWKGIGKAVLAYGADIVDGRVARATGTSSEVGAVVDAVGDKIKVGWALAHTVRLGLVDRDLAAVIALQNLANAGATVYDRVRNEEPVIEAAQQLGKYAMFGEAMSIGGQTVGAKVAETHPRTGGMIRKIARWVGMGTAATLGVASFVDYVRTARTGVKKVRGEARASHADITTNVTRRGIHGDY